MTALAFIGLVALVLIAIYLSVASIGGALASLGFTGKVSPEVYLFVILAVCAWGATFWLWPFEIVMKGGAE